MPQPRHVRVPIDADDLAVLQYTGGTTGTPKGAMLTHANIFANVVQTEAFMYRTRERGAARYLLVIPYFHIYGFTVGMMKGIWVGALQILIPKYDVEQVLAALRDHRPTYFPAVPTIFVSLLNHPRVKEFGLDQVRTFNSGGAPCPVEVIEQFERTIGRTLNEGYGLSETSPVTHSTPQLAARKPGTIGLPLPDTDMKIVDLDSGTRELPIGEAGELCIAGPQVMKGYWNRPDETAHVLRTHADGRIWFHTGDIARVDEDGYTTIVQRKKDMIIVDGFNVYPSEVEAVLYLHPGVRLAAVIGDPRRVSRRGRAGLRRAEAGRDRHGGRSDRALQDGARALQGAAARRSPRDAADERGREDPVPRAARRAGSSADLQVRLVDRRPDIRPLDTMPDTTSPSGLLEIRRKLSGLEFFQQMIAGEVPPPPMRRAARPQAGRGRGRTGHVHRRRARRGLQRHGRRARRLRRDDARFGARLRDQHDDAGRPRFTTLELKINYTRALRREAGELRCEATVVHVGSRTATSEGRIVDANGKIYAHGTTTCMLVEPPRGE